MSMNSNIRATEDAKDEFLYFSKTAMKKMSTCCDVHDRMLVASETIRLFLIVYGVNNKNQFMCLRLWVSYSSF